jgi:phosphoglycolate phosphatase
MSKSSTAVPAVETAEQPRSTAVPAVDSRLGPPRYVLFDIDGTLIDSQGAGGAALSLALVDEFAIANPRSVPLHGQTDLGVFSRLLSLNGLDDTAENFERLSNAYFARLPQELRRRGGRVLPGVQGILAELRKIKGCHVGLLTGNLPISAQMKLEHFGLWDAFDFGIFGDLGAQRPDLSAPTIAAVNNRSGQEVPPECIIVIGDTPLDVALARAMRARCLAVCTGGFAGDELLAAGACRAVDDLSDTTDLLNWIFTQTELSR